MFNCVTRDDKSEQRGSCRDREIVRRIYSVNAQLQIEDAEMANYVAGRDEDYYYKSLFLSLTLFDYLLITRNFVERHQSSSVRIIDASTSSRNQTRRTKNLRK